MILGSLRTVILTQLRDLATRRGVVVRDAVFLALGLGLARALAFFFRYCCLRILTVADYGRLALFMSGFQMLIPLASFQAGNLLAVIFGRRDEAQRPGEWVKACLAISVSTCVLLVPVALINTHRTGAGISGPLIVLIYVSLLSTSMMIMAEGIMRGLFKSWAAALVELIGALGKILILGSAIWLGYRMASGPLVAFLLGPCLAAVFGWVLVKRERVLGFAWAVSWPNLWQNVRWAVAFCGFIVLGETITYGMQFASRWVLSLEGYESVAVYDAAMLIYGIAQIAFAGVGLAVVPYASRAGSEGAFPWPWKKALLLYIPIGLLLVLLTVTPVIPNLFGWIGLAEYASAWPVLRVQLLAVPLELLFVIGTSILIGSGRTKEYSRIMLLVAPLHVFGAFLLASRWGGTGVAAMSVVSLGLLVWLMKRTLATGCPQTGFGAASS